MMAPQLSAIMENCFFKKKGSRWSREMFLLLNYRHEPSKQICDTDGFFIFLQPLCLPRKFTCYKDCCLIVKSCSTLSRPHGLYSPPGSSVHGISQTSILEWVAISFSRFPCAISDSVGISIRSSSV